MLKNLNKMKAKKAEDDATISEIKALVEELGVFTKSPDEMLAAYRGSEVVLLKNLNKLSSNKIKDAEVKAEATILHSWGLNAAKSQRTCWPDTMAGRRDCKTISGSTNS